MNNAWYPVSNEPALLQEGFILSSQLRPLPVLSLAAIPSPFRKATDSLQPGARVSRFLLGSMPASGSARRNQPLPLLPPQLQYHDRSVYMSNAAKAARMTREDDASSPSPPNNLKYICTAHRWSRLHSQWSARRLSPTARQLMRDRIHHPHRYQAGSIMPMS